MDSSLSITIPSPAPWQPLGVPALRPNDPPDAYIAAADELKLSKQYQAGITAMLAKTKADADKLHKGVLLA